jgi:hypothetical protein
MGMKQTIEVLDRMEAEGVIGRYCIAAAVAALNYVEVGSMEDLDILVSFEHAGPGPLLLTLTPIVNYLKELGYSEFLREGISIEGWPVRFLPVANDLDAEALEAATDVTVDFEGGSVRTRLLTPEHIIANALRIGRPKTAFEFSCFWSAT